MLISMPQVTNETLKILPLISKKRSGRGGTRQGVSTNILIHNRLNAIDADLKETIVIVATLRMKNAFILLGLKIGNVLWCFR